MKRLVLAAGLAALALGAVILAQQSSGDPEQELTALEKEWGNAYVNRDAAVIERIEAEDAVLTDSDGNLFTKAQDLAEVRAGIYALGSFAFEETHVHPYGDTAVFYGISRSQGTYKGQAFDNRSRSTDTWVRRDGRWQCVASHGSRIAEDPEAAKGKVNAVIDRWDRASETGDMSVLAKLVANDPDMVNLGTDAAERFVGYEAFADSMKRFFGSAEGTKVTTRDRAVKISRTGDVAWFSETWDQSGKSQGQAYDVKGSRLSGVLEKRNGQWVIVQIHASIPVPGQAIKY